MRYRNFGFYSSTPKEVNNYVIAVILFLFLYLAEQIAAVRLGYYLNLLNQKVGQLQVDNNNLYQEYNNLVSLSVLSDFARQKNMVAPKVTEIIYLETGGK